jgi:hypothetical protein
MRTRHTAMLDSIASSGKLPEGDGLNQAIEGYVESFLGG